ncbi:hypothetical protein F3Y22_tig00111427pilonHSYRG00251 [Hibiscus syriacus]|uniref:Uncharacterized protein n=1 Tax=Hibiscus syriacus TaxID=106335 RepID=A0A6A2XRR8_HIBSY|nr:hypothetical protein F3Y22_tig00111427pilonHSYRG00251 [Hibiscus syriacus]
MLHLMMLKKYSLRELKGVLEQNCEEVTELQIWIIICNINSRLLNDTVAIISPISGWLVEVEVLVVMRMGFPILARQIPLSFSVSAPASHDTTHPNCSISTISSSIFGYHKFYIENFCSPVFSNYRRRPPHQVNDLLTIGGMYWYFPVKSSSGGIGLITAAKPISETQPNLQSSGNLAMLVYLELVQQ